jgi:hypothetical protein
MMWNRKLLMVALLAGFAMGGLAACQKEPGPAEKAGKALDDAASEIRDDAKDALEAVEEKLDE